MEIEREANIRQQNSILVQRLLNIKQSFLGDVRFKTSLNKPAKEKNLFRIKTENQQLVNKLITISSTYDCRKTLRQTAKMQNLARSISKHRNILDVGQEFRQLKTSMQSRSGLRNCKTAKS
jgi:hypothetical protein